MNSNDADDPLPFVQLAAVTRNVLWFLKINDDARGEIDAAKRETERNDADDDPANRREVAIIRRGCPRK